MTIYQVTFKTGPKALLRAGMGKIETCTFTVHSYLQLLSEVKTWGDEHFKLPWEMVEYKELVEKNVQQKTGGVE